MPDLKDFNEYRHRMNQRILESGSLGLSRFWALAAGPTRRKALDLFP
jgi:hypothetical protein